MEYIMSIDEKDAKTQILNTSVLLFSANGYKETSIREISKQAGVNISMISYYFGGKDGILKDIVLNVTEGFTSILDEFDLDDITKTISILKRFLEYLENNRPKIKILISELGKGSEYLLPVKKKITELQEKLSGFIVNKDGAANSSELAHKLKIMTDIILGMIFSDYVLDLSSFQESIPQEERKKWREERIQMLLKILEQLSGINTGKLTFESIF
jgi:AcrR family transcriptional regulator